MIGLITGLPAIDATGILGTLVGLLVVAGLSYGLFRAFRSAQLPHPRSSTLLLAMTVVTAVVQFAVMLQQVSDVGFYFWVIPFARSVVAIAVGGIAVLAVLAYTRGRGLLWAALGLAVVVALRILWDGYAIEEDKRLALARERAEYDRVTAILASDPPATVLSGVEGWTTVSVGRYWITYERADGAEFATYSWALPEEDQYAWSEDGHPDPLRSGCEGAYDVCENFEAGGRAGVVFQDAGDPHDFAVRVVVDSDPETYLDVERRRGDLMPEDLIELADDFRPIEEGDVERIAEEVTGGPRP